MFDDWVFGELWHNGSLKKEPAKEMFRHSPGGRGVLSMIIKFSQGNTTWPGQPLIESRVDFDMCRDSQACIFIYGHPFDPVSKEWTNAESVLKSFRRKKLDFVSGLEGVYTIVLQDIVRKRSFVVTDRYGIYSLFFSRGRDALIVSDDLLELAGAIPKVELNEQSVIEYLHLGFKLGTKTLLENVNEFDSGRIYEIGVGLEIAESAYWSFAAGPTDDKMTKEDFRQTFNSHVDVAMELPGHVSMPLSGGLDTRMILSACLDRKDKFHCFTYGVPDSTDVKVAARICRHFDIAHTKYPLTDHTIQLLPDIVGDHKNAFNGQISTFMFLLHNLVSCEGEQEAGDVLMSGVGANEIWRSLLWHWGARWDEFHGMETDLSRDVAATLLRVFSIGRSEIQFGVYRNYSSDEIKERLVSSFEQEMNKAERGAGAVQKCSVFMFHNYLGNIASSVLKYLGRHMKIFPAFLHKDLLLQIPHISLPERNEGEIQKYVLDRNDSYLGGMILNNGQIASSSAIASLKVELWNIRRRLAGISNRLSARAGLKSLFHPFVKEVNYHDWIRQYSRTLKGSVLESNSMKAGSLFLPDKFDQSFAQYQNGDNSLTAFYSNILAFELWSESLPTPLPPRG